MKTPEHERLLKEVLATGDYPAFRSELAEQLRRQMIQRRFSRRASYLALAASVAVLAVILLRAPHHTGTGTNQAVRTTPLKAAYLVRTTAQPMTIVRTTTFAQLIATATHGRPVPRLTDDELLSMFPGKPVALVSDTKGHRQLIVLDSNEPQIFGPGADTGPEL